ncbi:MAG: hypothetical protein JO242_25065 [Streptosporangiaceae bacterium]|nr:hypothetical protein [Streptosporangiaceae bacterium]
MLLSAVPLAASLAVAATGGSASAAGGNPPVNNPPAGGPSYSKTVAEQIILGGDHTGNGYNGTYIPPDCWLQPYFHQPQSYQAGDPSSAGPVDADSYYFWFGRHYPGFNHLIHGTGGPDQINQDFQMVQKGQNDVPGGPNPVKPDFVWWAPDWLSSPAGWACAQGLTANLNNGFIDLEPPAQPGAGGAAGQITNEQLAALARAALALPGIKIVTSPPAANGGPTTSYVNLPTYVSVHFLGAQQPSDTATVKMADGTVYLTATITTTKPTVSITTNAPADVSVPPQSTCPATAAGTAATPACSVKFLSPSSPAAPYVITVTVTWVVHWITSADPVGGVFQNPPSVVTAQQSFVVKEIQTVNGG